MSASGKQLALDWEIMHAFSVTFHIFIPHRRFEITSQPGNTSTKQQGQSLLAKLF